MIRDDDYLDGIEHCIEEDDYWERIDMLGADISEEEIWNNPYNVRQREKEARTSPAERAHNDWYRKLTKQEKRDYHAQKQK